MADYFLHYFSFVTSSINSLNGYDGLILHEVGTITTFWQTVVQRPLWPDGVLVEAP